MSRHTVSNAYVVSYCIGIMPPSLPIYDMEENTEIDFGIFRKVFFLMSVITY